MLIINFHLNVVFVCQFILIVWSWYFADALDLSFVFGLAESVVDPTITIMKILFCYYLERSTFLLTLLKLLFLEPNISINPDKTRFITWVNNTSVLWPCSYFYGHFFFYLWKLLCWNITIVPFFQFIFLVLFIFKYCSIWAGSSWAEELILSYVWIPMLLLVHGLWASNLNLNQGS